MLQGAPQGKGPAVRGRKIGGAWGLDVDGGARRGDDVIR
jgi:hypothetical protein